jgi:arylsulfatase A-like enzyme
MGALAGFGQVELPATDQGRLDAAEVTDRSLAALRAGAEPHLLWAHYMDAHTPYLPVPADPTGHVVGRVSYAVRLSHVDRQIGRLAAGLEKDDPGLGRTAIVVTADHGEAYGEHGVYFHGFTNYEPIVRVPALIVAPGLTPGVHDGLLGHRDVASTLLGAFGHLGEDGEVFGRSWLRLRGAPRPELHRFVVTRSFRVLTLRGGGTVPQASIVAGPLKLTKTFADGLQVLYDVDADPGEQRDLLLSRRDAAAALSRSLELYRDLDAYP